MSNRKAALVLSVGHTLLPFAYRLVREGLDVEVAVVHSPPRYQQAWAGKFKPFLEVRKGGLDEETRKALLETATTAEAFVVTNSRALTDAFAGQVPTYGQLPSEGTGAPTAVAVGAWWDGAGFSGTHLWVRDLGLWPGGQGPSVLAGGTLVRLEEAPAWATAALTTAVVPATFKGLVAVDVVVEQGPPAKVVPAGRWEAGWPFGHTHAFVSDQPSLASVLEGFEPQFPKAYTTVAVVSVPPWPIKCNVQPEPHNIEGPTPQQVGQTFFHDMQLEGQQLRLVGLDGLVGVARGSANQLELARRHCLGVAQAIRVPERQLRGDCGVAAAHVLPVLEELGLLLGP